MSDLTANETLIMKCIWSIDGTVTFYTLVDEVNKRFGKKWEHGEIYSILLCIKRKKFIQIYPVGKNHIIKPLLEEEIFRETQMKKIEPLHLMNQTICGL